MKQKFIQKYLELEMALSDTEEMLILPEADAPRKNDGAVQLDLFTDYAAEEEKQKADLCYCLPALIHAGFTITSMAKRKSGLSKVA